jgi:antitoxin ParD1/3/4
MANPERFETELPPDLAQYVHSRVGHGALASDSDVLREAVRQAAQLDAFQEAARKKIAAGVASLRAGKGVDGETFMAALDADLAAQEL